MSLELGLRLDPLTPGERRELVRLARKSIEAALQGVQVPQGAVLSGALREVGAAFVSLHCAGRLRGCIGSLAADKPLYETVAQMAQSAALDDPRFQPLRIEELHTVEIEISRLSPLVPARPDDVQPGVHGVSLAYGERRAVFLPQVALHYGWDRPRLLVELCRKAILPDDVWMRPDVSLSVFLAEVFGETGGEGA